MKIRLSLSTRDHPLRPALAVGFASVVLTGAYALKELKVGGPLYGDIKLGNDLVADILPPPAYVIEAYLEATLALREPKNFEPHEKKLLQLKKDYEDRKTFWTASELQPDLKTMLVEKSDAEVKKFWQILETELLPALRANDTAKAEAAYARLTECLLGPPRRHRRPGREGQQAEFGHGSRRGRRATAACPSWSGAVSGLVLLIVVAWRLRSCPGRRPSAGAHHRRMRQIAEGDLATEVPFADRQR